ncbi:transglutaminase-like cysteine peptidase [Rhodoplanes sp. TEM]|uniref:Transglutaminase-like cysteine peptidase n=1 Tax=Rhodoplanes tepidamans TaxID=200616 RepID=A0ABT5JGM0_RHOTP|nr:MULTISPECIES: transglutaminase-like cysteine peptidase [Rhodoplanes]MDC7788863.1 transglutaminase-like cysteine peptidase [Rhodoplanes tepidamans]MDC7986706.1 transglutaminase-like cysteine peptidase [Rhodoplanes sp. TEM]MDQ0357840.1 putative transglutaminase-like cysteine proteinase [Rhodoplanes tepidamans]
MSLSLSARRLLCLAITAAGLVACAAADRATAQISAAVTRPTMALAEPGEPFGRSLVRAPDGRLTARWRTVQAEMAAEAPRIAACRAAPAACPAEAEAFVALVDAAAARTGVERLDRLNRAVNETVRFVADLDQHGVADRWSAPLATLATRQGDCEDIAILKYAVLRAAGTPEADLRLLVVRDRWVGDVHAVLSVRDGSRWYLLDNRWAEPRVDAALPRFAPLFALGAAGVDAYAEPDGPAAAAVLRTAAR